MMTTNEPIHLAQAMAAHARAIYEADHDVNTMVWAMEENQEGVIMAPNPDYGLMPREHVAFCVHLASAFIDVRYAAFAVEAWMKAFPEGTDGVPHRGYLESIADTDPEVRTTVMVSVIDIKEPERSHSVMSTAGGDDPREIEWDILDMEGLPEGGMADAILYATVNSKPTTPPTSNLDHLLEALVNGGVCLMAARWEP